VWRISDPVLYHNSVGAQGKGDSYIKDQVFSATNSTLGAYELSQLVSLETDKIKLDEIQAEICRRVQQTCRENYGIEVSDVNILRLTLPTMNLQSVFSQMSADRQKDISAIIADAQLKATEITSTAAQEAAAIIAEGTTEAARIRAETETEVARIYAEAQAANLELYQFLMNLDTMIASVDENTVLIVKADEYPFNILMEYSKHMTVEGDAVVINDLSYILGQLSGKDRKALVDGVMELIREAKKKAD